MSSKESNKKITWSRVARNLARILKNCTPPVLHRPLGLSRPEQSADMNSLVEEPQPKCEIEFKIPVTNGGEIWPGFDQIPVAMFTRQIRNHLWAMPENELIVLATICKVLQPQRVFEFGTFTGASTLAIASNSAENVQVHTLDIPPENRKTHRTGVGSDIPFEFEIGEAFKGTEWEKQIEVITCDAKQLDVTPFQNQMDLVFVDADHTYSFVKNDTEKALEMIKPGGVILWHDYRWDELSPECAGVTRLVNEFHETNGECHEIQGTRFAVYQSPLATSQSLPSQKSHPQEAAA